MALGIGQVKPQFDSAYEEVIARLKDGYDTDAPKHVGRRRFIVQPTFREDGM